MKQKIKTYNLATKHRRNRPLHEHYQDHASWELQSVVLHLDQASGIQMLNTSLHKPAETLSKLGPYNPMQQKEEFYTT